MDTKVRYRSSRMSAKKGFGIAMLVFSILVFILSCVPNFLGIGKFFQGVFGVTVYPLCLLLGLVSIALLSNLRFTLNAKYVVYLTLSFFFVLSLFHTIFTTNLLYDDMVAFEDFDRYINCCFKMTEGITVGGVILGSFVFLIRSLIGLMGTFAFLGVFSTVFIGLMIDYAIYNRKKQKRREELTKPYPTKQVDANEGVFATTDEELYSFSKKTAIKKSYIDEFDKEEQVGEQIEPTLLFETTDTKTQDLLEADSDINFSFNSEKTGEDNSSNQRDYAKSVLFGEGEVKENPFAIKEDKEDNQPKSARDILFGAQPKVPNIFDKSSEERNAWRSQYNSKPLEFKEEEQNNSFSQVGNNPFASQNEEVKEDVSDQTYDQNDDGSIKTSWGSYRPTSSFNQKSSIDEARSARSREINRNNNMGVSELNRFGGRQDSSNFETPVFGEPTKNIFDDANRNLPPQKDAFGFRTNQPQQETGFGARNVDRSRVRERTSVSNFNRIEETNQDDINNTDFSSRFASHENRMRNGDLLANASSLGIEMKEKEEETTSFTSILDSTRRVERPSEPVKQEKPKVEKISFESQLNKKYSPPPTDLLNLVKEEKVDYSAEYREKSTIIESTLSNFKIPAKVNNVVRGPKVTRYELAMPMGIPVSRVLAYEKDLSMNLASRSGVRIEAPIPGKNAFGIEVENAKPSMVGFRELVESGEFKTFKNPLPVAIGKNISGEIIVKSLGKMVHCLVAGSTGSGKSVFLHSLIVSLMYRHSPEELRFIMIDPKRVEFSRYNRMPHLMLPEVVTECSKAVNSLNWAVKEMERRYELLRVNECQKLEQFNECPAVKEGREKKLPYLVIVVDELAELMSVAAKEAESRIQRITQLGRAAGIHMVIATQRPSVDVVTGVIKNNLPTRIAFALASQVDSQTIINQAGAEKLLGQGDMLLSAQDSNAIVRLQAAFVSDEEIKKVLNYIKENNICVYDEEIQKSIYAEPEEESKADDDNSSGGGNNEDRMDEYMPQALKLVMKNGKASISMIQRRFSVGYARAARIIDQMETRGFIDGGLGNKPRDVKITIAEYNELFGDFDSD